MEGSHGGGWLPWPYVNLPPRAASRRGLLRPRNFSYRLRNPFRFVLKRQIGLGDHPNDAVFGIYDGNSPDLMFLHQALASLDILALAAANRRQADHLLDRRGLWIHALRNDRATQIAICDYAHLVLRLLVRYHRHGTDVAIAQDFATACALSLDMQQAGFWLMISLIFSLYPHLYDCFIFSLSTTCRSPA